jgi:PAS domain S-box-containing protein
VRGPLSRLRFSLRAYLALLVTAAVLPVALFAVWLTVTVAHEQRDAQRGRLQDTARAVAVAIERDLRDDVHTLQAVAASSSLDGADRETLRAELRQVAAAQREWLAIRLHTPDGRCVVDTQDAREVGAGPSAFAVRVPVVRDGLPRYVLSASVSAGVVSDLFGREVLPARWIGSLVDGHGETFARSPAGPPSQGASPRFPISRAGVGGGWGGRAEMPDGPVYFAYARPQLTDWHVVLAAPVAVLDRPWMRSLASLVVGGVAVLLVAGLLAALAVRPITGSVSALAGAAADLGHGRRPPPLGSAVADLAPVSRDLEAAAHGRESAEHARRESLAQLAALVNQATAGVAQLGRDGLFILVNRRYGDLAGRPPAELIGHRLEEVLHPDDRAREVAALRALTPDAPERATETRYRRPDGSDRWVDASLSLVHGADAPASGAADSVTIVALDATARRAALDAARAGDTRFRTMADAAPVLVWLAAPDARRTWFNSQWLAFVGSRLDEEIGAGWLAHVHPDDRARCTEAATRDYAARRRCRLVYRLRRHDGMDRWVHDDGVPLLAADGTFTGYVGACVDVTGEKLAELERRELLERERKARREAEAASQAKDEFLAALSHELRTPLHALRLWAGILRNGLHDPQALARAADTIDRNAVLQSRLVDDLLDVSRIVSGQLRLTIEWVAIGPIVEAAVETVRPAALNKGVALIQDLAPGVGSVRGDAIRLQQVVWNLLANAVRFTPAGGRVEVRLRPVDGEAELSVTDSGRGIGAGLLPHVFDRFRQGESGTNRSHGGLGLGLSLARQLVELHGGTIEAASRGPGRGATFTVRLPVARADPPPAPPASGSGASGSARSLEHVRVLVVDDDAETREVMAVALGREGAIVTTAPSVGEAVAIIERGWPDVLLSDIGMPGGNGYDLIRKVRHLEAIGGRHLPAIALTGYAADDDQRRVLEAGFDAHVAKPVPAATMAPLIATLLEREGGLPHNQPGDLPT